MHGHLLCLVHLQYSRCRTQHRVFHFWICVCLSFVGHLQTDSVFLQVCAVVRRRARQKEVLDKLHYNHLDLFYWIFVPLAVWTNLEIDDKFHSLHHKWLVQFALAVTCHFDCLLSITPRVQASSKPLIRKHFNATKFEKIDNSHSRIIWPKFWYDQFIWARVEAFNRGRALRRAICRKRVSLHGCKDTATDQLALTAIID